MVRRNTVQEDATIADMAMAAQAFDIVLQPLSHPEELDEIYIEEDLFAIGRTEPPFASYAPEWVADLSRRHAKIFVENGAVYIADLNSKNGTTVNGMSVQQKITRLRDGDELCFGGALSYRVQLRQVSGITRAPAGVAKLASLTLAPERDDLGLQPIVITQFPFLISKADETFSRYKNAFPHQVNYISRRHAHIFLKGGAPFIEDLGSTNGTFVAGKRLDEHAVPLKDGDVLAFGGHHFVYNVTLQYEEAAFDPTMTKISPAAARAAAGDADKTTFVAAADSFLDIFCVEQAPRQDDEVNKEAEKQSDDAGREGEKYHFGNRFAAFASELTDAFTGRDRSGLVRMLRWGGGLLVLLIGLALVLHLTTAPERELQDQLASGDHAQAATLASSSLQRDPNNAALRALGTEALLKAHVPTWTNLIKARDFNRAEALVGQMKALARYNADAQPLVNEIGWIGSVERFVISRGGVDAPIRLYADEDNIRRLLKQWDEDTPRHQRAFATISSMVPEFKDTYAEALSYLRKLQSDDTVYLTAIERLKTMIGAELNRDQPGALENVLKEYAEKYPRLGLDGVRQDVRQYLAIDNEMRARRIGPLVALISQATFSTPPFQAKFRALTSSDRLPPANVMQQLQAISGAWRRGEVKQAIEGLQTMNAGAWADAVTKELERKKAIAEQFASLQAARNGKDYEERLLSFYGSLDTAEDVYFVRATDADIRLYKDKALGRAQALMNRAQAQWTQYRQNGPIQGEQRLDSKISNTFRTQAQLLSGAEADAQQGMRIVTQLKMAPSTQWRKLKDEIDAEVELQRKSLLDLRMVLTPALLKAKLALIGERRDEDRTSP